MPDRLAARVAISSAAAALAVSCGFLLDYDALQKGSGDAGASGASAGTAGRSGTGVAGAAGSAGVGGAAGSSPCGVCDDGNPCTVDYCDTSSGTPTCAANGVKLDGLEQRISVARVHRVTVAAASNAFFLSAFTASASGAETTLYRVGTASSDASLQEIGQLSRAQTAGRPSSAASLVVDTRSGLNLDAYVAIRAATESQVHRIVLDGTYQVIADEPLSTTAGYDDTLPSRIPYAWKLGSSINATWINADATISLGQTTTTGTTVTAMGGTDAAMRPSGVVGLGTAQDTPVVMWTGIGSGTWTQVLGGQPEAVTECMPEPGTFLPSLDTTWGELAGLWFTSWSKATPTALATETRAVLCDETTTPKCSFDPKCDGNALKSGIRNAATDAMTRPGDSPGAFIVGIADPFISPTDGVASILIYAARFDFGPVPFQNDVQTQIIGFAQPEAVTSSGPSWPGPDLPAIALAAPDKMLVAWIDSSTTSDELVVQRYQLCLP